MPFQVTAVHSTREYEIQPRKHHRGVDFFCDVPPFGHLVEDAPGKADSCLRVVQTRLWGTGYRHVCIADGLDLLDPVDLGQLVEPAEQIVEEGDHERRIRALGPRREPDEVGKHDCRVRVGIRDPDLAVLEPVGDRPRDGVGQ